MEGQSVKLLDNRGANGWDPRDYGPLVGRIMTIMGVATAHNSYFNDWIIEVDTGRGLKRGVLARWVERTDCGLKHLVERYKASG